MGVDVSILNKQNKEREPSSNFKAAKLNNPKLLIGQKFKNKDREAFYKDLATILNAGVDFKSSLEILANQQKKKSIQQLISAIEKDVVGGRTFYEALFRTGKFSSYEVSSIKIGEETKKLGQVLLELHLYFKRQIKLRRQVVSVVTYPIFVLILTLGVFYFMLKYVVPMFKSVFNQFDAELPGLTKKVIALSENFSMIVLAIVIFVLAIIISLKVYGKKPRFRNFMARMVLKVPYFGKLIKTIKMARFCQFLSLLLSSKTSLPESLSLVKDMIGYYPIESSIEAIRKDILRGINFSVTMGKHYIYDNKLISMVAVAEEINELDSMFERLAEEYNDEVEHRTKMIGVVVEPLIIVFIGLIVGIVMIAMYAPMFDLSKIIG